MDRDYLGINVPVELLEPRSAGDVPRGWKFDSCDNDGRDCHVPLAQHVAQNIVTLRSLHVEIIDIFTDIVRIKNIGKNRDTVNALTGLIEGVTSGAWFIAFMRWCREHPADMDHFLGLWDDYMEGKSRDDLVDAYIEFAGSGPSREGYRDAPRVDLKEQLKMFDDIVEKYYAYVLNDLTLFMVRSND